MTRECRLAGHVPKIVTRILQTEIVAVNFDHHLDAVHSAMLGEILFFYVFACFHNILMQH